MSPVRAYAPLGRILDPDELNASARPLSVWVMSREVVSRRRSGRHGRQPDGISIGERGAGFQGHISARAGPFVVGPEHEGAVAEPMRLRL